MNRIEMWTNQTPVVVDDFTKNGVSFVKKEYIRQKYGEVAWVFETAYSFMRPKMSAVLPKPDGAESPVWMYRDKIWVPRQAGSCRLRLLVPSDELVLFSLKRWQKILALSYIGTEEETQKFNAELERAGIKNSMQLFSTAFYPVQKKKVTDSWQNILDISDVDEKYQQGATWCIKKEWVQDIEYTNK